MQRHRLGIGRRHDQAGRDAALRTGGAEQIGPVVASIARRARSASTLCPNPGQGALLANPGLVLEPDFDRLAMGMLWKPRGNRRGEVFLNAS
jgi:hypothetical protein